MMTTKTAPLTLEKRRTLKAPVDKVFKAWTDPEQMSKWFGCGTTTDLRIAQDFRVGGQYTIICGTDGCDEATMSGTFKEIELNRKIAYSWNNDSQEYPAKDTLVTVEFIEKDENTTEIIVTHSNFATPNSIEGHTFGWTAALDRFASLFDAA